MRQDIKVARRKGVTHRLLGKGTSDQPEQNRTECPSQAEWPLACPCVSINPTSSFEDLLKVKNVAKKTSNGSEARVYRFGGPLSPLHSDISQC